jgi:acetoin utilization deacetylase AcuC-like enzyme
VILHSNKTVLGLGDFGIHVPAIPDRGGRIIAALRNNDELRSRETEWRLSESLPSFTREDLLRVHTETYVHQLLARDPVTVVESAFELRHADGSYNRYTPDTAKLSLADLRDNRLASAAGSYRCCLEAIDTGFCFYLGGGSHHAHSGFGHGFCIVNDAALAIRKLQHEHRIGTAWVIDVDAHKGDGTASIFSADASTTTLSVHMAHGWPLDRTERMPDGSIHPSYISSDIDVPIDSGEEPTYVSALEASLDKLATYPQPDIAVVLLGADPYEHDALPSTAPLQLSLEQLSARDALIYEFLETTGVPQAYLMAGGYGERAWEPYPPFLESVILRRLTT